MSPEAQRIAIAEACGWRYAEMCPWAPWVSPYNNKSYQLLPDYLTDLNAMHEVEKVLPTWNALPIEHNMHRYFDYLVDVCRGCTRATVATAAQRAEAFLRTIGKWEDGK